MFLHLYIYTNVCDDTLFKIMECINISTFLNTFKIKMCFDMEFTIFS